MKSATSTSEIADTSRHERLERLRRIAWLLDNSIPLPGGFRVGLDAVVGLLPGVGDAIGALFSAYIINEARALGASRSVLLRMMGNVLLETVIGAVPFAGDLFDAAFKANARNIALLKRYHADPRGSRRRSRWLVAGFTLLLALLAVALIAIPILLVMGVVHLVG